MPASSTFGRADIGRELLRQHSPSHRGLRHQHRRHSSTANKEPLDLRSGGDLWNPKLNSLLLSAFPFCSVHATHTSGSARNGRYSRLTDTRELVHGLHPNSELTNSGCCNLIIHESRQKRLPMMQVSRFEVLARKSAELSRKPLILARRSAKLSTKPLIVSAGMRRSGSTLLFNMLREILVTKWKTRLSSGWEGDFASLPNGSVYLIKTHNLSRFLRWRARYCFFTYRDVRVAVVSDLRRFDRQITLESIRFMIRQYEIAKKTCKLIIKYEELIRDHVSFIHELSRILDIKVDSESIYHKTIELKPPHSGTGYSSVTLLHEGHLTHTKDHEWRQIIPSELQLKISEELSWWFSECGYPPE